ncbi:MAG: Fic family protein [Spirochaetaceae bacterium]|nr:Fic family protein [Spirochaetaceae bacterium]
MIFAAPAVTEADERVLGRIERRREELRFYLHRPRRWYGTLRRVTEARAIQGSNAIEGYHSSVEDVAAIMEGEEPSVADPPTRDAISGYRDAMTYVISLAPTAPAIDASLLKSLHFMMLKHDLDKAPGQWRPGDVSVSNADGDVVYSAPDRDLVEPLMEELIEQIALRDAPIPIVAAMAHLNLAMIHPFSDGNGRMARCLQTFVLAADGTLSPEFASIEEYLGRNTLAYYDVLAEVGQGRWSPHRDAGPWVRFCMTAHYRQAAILLRRVRETEALWDRCEQVAASHRLSDRVVGALCDACRGWRLRRPLYMKTVASSTGEEITAASATRDLAAMVTAGLLVPSGEKRGRSYHGTELLRSLWQEIRHARLVDTAEDPYRSD